MQRCMRTAGQAALAHPSLAYIREASRQLRMLLLDERVRYLMIRCIRLERPYHTTADL